MTSIRRRHLWGYWVGILALLIVPGAARAGEDAPEAMEATPEAPAKAPAPAPERRKVLVPQVTVTGLPPEAAAALTDALAEGIAQNPAFEVISHSTIVQLLGLEAQRQLLGCDDETCFTEIAGALDADIMVRGTVYRANKITTIYVTLFDLAEGKPSPTRSRQTTDADQIPGLLRILGAEATGATPPHAWLLAAGLISPPHWRIELYSGARGLGVFYRTRLEADVPEGVLLPGDVPPPGVGAYAFDTKEKWSPMVGLGLRRALLPWLEIGLRLGYARWRAEIKDYPVELVSVEEVVTDPETDEQRFAPTGPVRVGCPLRYRAGDTSSPLAAPEWSGDGSVLARSNDVLTRPGPDPEDPDTERRLAEGVDWTNSAYGPDLYSAELPLRRGVCGLESHLFEADLVLGLRTHLLSWLLLGLDARLGFSTGGFDWGGDSRPHMNAWRLGLAGRILIAWGHFFDALPDTLSLDLGLVMATQGSLNSYSSEALAAAKVKEVRATDSGGNEVVQTIEGIDTTAQNPGNLWGGLLRFEVGLSYAF